MWLLYVSAARLGRGGMFDQCGYYMSLLQTWWRRHVCSVVLYITADLVEEALISVVTICRCCKTWWRGHV